MCLPNIHFRDLIVNENTNRKTQREMETLMLAIRLQSKKAGHNENHSK